MFDLNCRSSVWTRRSTFMQNFGNCMNEFLHPTHWIKSIQSSFLPKSSSNNAVFWNWKSHIVVCSHQLPFGWCKTETFNRIFMLNKQLLTVRSNSKNPLRRFHVDFHSSNSRLVTRMREYSLVRKSCSTNGTVLGRRNKVVSGRGWGNVNFP